MISEDDNVFGEPISVYTDDNAVEDGILVPVTKQDRVTRPLWAWLTENTPLAAEPPNCWPVDMLGWFRTKPDKLQARKIAAGGPEALAKHEEEVRNKKALALADGLICCHRRQAMTVYEQNIDGGIYKLLASVTNGKITGINETGIAVAGDRTLWFVPNELGGLTMMFPEDY